MHFQHKSRNQTTLYHSIAISGVGLHGGVDSEISLIPAAVGEGRVFVKMKDNNEEGRILANLDSLHDTRLCTILGNNHIAIHTVEHLLSSLEGMGVDNVRIELRGGNEV